MAYTQNIAIGIPGQSETFQKISVSPTDWSNYFAISYSIMKAYSYAKPIKTISSGIERETNEIITTILSSASLQSDHRTSVEYFKSIFDFLVNAEDYKTTLTYFNHYASDTKYLNHILIAGYHISYQLVLENGGDLATIISTDPTKIIQFFCEKFPIYVNLIWPDQQYLYSNSSNSPGILLSFYLENDANMKYFYSVLLKNGEDQVEYSASDPSEYLKAFCYNYEPAFNPVESSNKMNISVFSSNFPNLLNLVTVLVKKIALNKIYDKDIDDALKAAIKETPDLGKIHTIQRIYNQKKFVCDKHPDSGFIETFCGFEHCKVCIFTIIKAEASKGPGISIFCPCKLSIPPKQVSEIRRSEDFKSFLQNR